MRILQVCSSLTEPLGGAEQYCLELSKWLAMRGHATTVASAAMSPQVRQSLLDHNVGAIVRGPWRPYVPGEKGPNVAAKVVFHSLDALSGFRGSLERTLHLDDAFDVAHVHRFQGIGLGALRSTSLPVVHTVHDFALVDSRATSIREGRAGDDLPVIQGVRTRLTNRVVRDVNRLIFPSERTRSRHADLGLRTRPGQSIVIPHGWRVASRAQEHSQDRTFLFLGKLTLEKGLPLLLEAWAQGIPGARLLIAGAGPLEAECRRRAGSHGVEFLGWLDPEARARAMASADVLVLPSAWPENFPLVVAEALASGVPVIATAIASPPLVEHGRSGLIVAHQAGAVRRSMETLTGDQSLLAVLSRGARDCAEELDFDVHGERVLHILAGSGSRARDRG